MDTSLFAFLNAVKPIHKDDWGLFLSCLSEKEIPKQTVLLKEGDVCSSLFFIEYGSIRSYHLKDGQEINTAFFFEHTFATAFESLTSGKPSHVFLETMEPTRIITINRNKLIALYDEAPVFESIGRIILETILSQRERYAELFTFYSPTERYIHLTKHHPELLQRVPLQFLASYLGVTRETLSRIRKRIS